MGSANRNGSHVAAAAFSVRENESHVTGIGDGQRRLGSHVTLFAMPRLARLGHM